MAAFRLATVRTSRKQAAGASDIREFSRAPEAKKTF
jgi:hypothetical protein